jgi:ribonucleoside-diphosphate reductase alpha chain
MVNAIVRWVRKRDGSIEKFDQGKITNAILKALAAVFRPDRQLAQRLSDRVVLELGKVYGKKIPTIENIQDTVEFAMKTGKQEDVYRAYHIYRRERAKIREMKRTLFGVYDDLKMDVNAVQVLSKRYLIRDDSGKVIETPKGMFRRVARVAAAADAKYGGKPKKMEDIFYRMLTNLEFVPNSPTLMNSGTPLGQLSACFVLPVEDSLEGIFDTLKHAAIIHQSGGGTGFSFSRIRPRGDMVRSTKSVASGPVSFMRIYDSMTETIKQGGRRRGANMGILRCDHPDIFEFIASKSKGGIANFNISVAATDGFISAVENDDEYELVNPRTQKAVKTVKARDVFNQITSNAWNGGDPGLVFIDEINRKNQLKRMGPIEATNPCGEVPLLPYESCNLASINLDKMLVHDHGDFDWDKLRESVHAIVHFLDNLIDANRYPLPKIQEVSQANRRLGLGVMGWADALLRIGVKYDSKEALRLAEKLMRFVNEEAHKKSEGLGRGRGSFSNFRMSTWAGKYKSFRNTALTTIAPTGTISIIAGCSSGIEPIFAVSFVRNVLEGTKLLETNKVFEEVARKRGFYSRELMERVAREGSIKKIQGIPKDVKDLFATALDIEPEWHVRMQAAFQKHTDNAVSKTVNLPYDAKPEDIEEIYMLAHKLKCKGITVFRYGSRAEQVLYIGRPGEKRGITASPEFAGYCPGGVCPF